MKRLEELNNFFQRALSLNLEMVHFIKLGDIQSANDTLNAIVLLVKEMNCYLFSVSGTDLEHEEMRIAYYVRQVKKIMAHIYQQHLKFGKCEEILIKDIFPIIKLS